MLRHLLLVTKLMLPGMPKTHVCRVADERTRMPTNAHDTPTGSGYRTGNAADSTDPIHDAHSRPCAQDPELRHHARSHAICYHLRNANSNYTNLPVEWRRGVSTCRPPTPRLVAEPPNDHVNSRPAAPVGWHLGIEVGLGDALTILDEHRQVIGVHDRRHARTI